MTVLRIAVIPWETILAPVLPATDWQVMVEGAMVSTLVSANWLKYILLQCRF